MATKRKSLDTFTFRDGGSPPNVELPLEAIVLSPYQPRFSFDSQRLEKLALSIKQQGILTRLIVRPATNSDKYELVAGGRRFEAAALAGLREVPAVIMQLTDEQAREIALLENLQREDLNPLEETEGVINLLSVKLQLSPSAIPALLHRLQEVARGRKKSSNNVVGEAEQLKIIQQVFASVGLMEFDSFISHRLPLLNIPESLLKALRSGQIAYTKALAIAKVKEPQQQQKLLKEVTEQNFSLSQIRAKVSEFNQIKNEQVGAHELTLKEKVERTYRRLRQSKALENPQKQKQLRNLLEKIEALLED